jgi:AcrR family transcriptional regulator
VLAPAPLKLESISRSRVGPGRPEGVSRVKDDILDSAEIEFADRGYAGTSLRTIADRSNVTQALINYYFGSKHGLFTAVYLRNGQDIVEERTKRLSSLRRRRKRPSVRDVIEAFLLPALKIRGTPAGRTFMRLNARLHTEPPEIAHRLREAVYDASTRLFADMLGEAMPHLAAKDVYWRVTFIVGAYLYAFSDNHRLSVIAPGTCDSENEDEILEAITVFATAGMSGPASDMRRKKSRL